MDTTEYQWLAVRCCCQPTKVLGFLRVTAQQANGRYLTLRPAVRRLAVSESAWRFPETSITLDPPVQLEIRNIGDSSGGSYAHERAVYSEDRPIEFWREQPNFVEAIS